MKMTRNRNHPLLGARGWLAVLAVLLAPLAAAGASRAQAPGSETVAIELNKLEPQGEACRAYLVVKNNGEEGFDSLKLDLVMFDRAGVVAKRLAVQAAPLPAGKTSLKVFDIEGNDCADIGSILLNDVMDCAPAPGTGAGCLAVIAVSARGEVTFVK